MVAYGLPPGSGTTPQASTPCLVDVAVIPLPNALRAYLTGANKSSEGLSLKLKFAFPQNKPAGAFTLPVLGTMGGEVSVAGQFSYHIRTRQWEMEIGSEFEGESSKYSAFKLQLGPMDDISAEIKGKGKGTASISHGIDFSGFEVGAALALSGKHKIADFTPFSLLGPVVHLVTDRVKWAKKKLKAVTVQIWFKPGLNGELEMEAYPDFGVTSFELTGTGAVEAEYESKKFRIYVGGEPRIKFGIPGEFFKELRVKAYAGIEVSLWVFDFETEYVFIEFPNDSASSMNAQAAPPAEEVGVLAATSNATAGWRPMVRPWRQVGEEKFMAAPPEAPPSETNEPGEASSGLDAFIRMGQSVSEENSAPEGGGVAAMMIPSDPETPVEATFPLLENVFPKSEPALAGRGNELMLLYVRDTGAASTVQFTEVAFSRFDGVMWSAPESISSDPRGQFDPQVAYDGDGNAMAVFARVKDAGFAGVEPEDMSAQMEIVWSRWDNATATWSTPEALTDNAFLDFKPQLSGPLADGDLLLTWNQNEANETDGTGAPGAVTNMRVMTRRWDRATQTWSAAEVLVTDLTGELSESLAAAGDKGVYAWTLDMDDEAEGYEAAEVFYRLYNATTGIWGAATRHTTDAVPDRNARVVLDAAGNVYAVWSRNDDLVMDVNFAGTPTVVRTGSTDMGFEDFAATIGPAGNLALIWQEMTEHGADAHYRVYDPASGTWGQDSFLSQDSDLERSFAPVWDAAGNLTLAYNNVQITKVTKNVVVEGGGVIEVEGVPQPGQVDLMLAKRALVRDLVAVPEGLTADGTTFLPGDALTLKARVKNSGNLAVSNVEVAFYDGDPDNGGTLIGAEIIPGWLEAAAETEVTLNWTVPQPEQARTIHLKIDPASLVSESDETNNTLALPINGVDLALEYQSGSVLRDGSARVVVKVRNLSAPESPVTTLRLKAADGGATLAETSVSQLAPGQSVDIPFDLIAGTHPEGDRAYLLVIDEEDFASDIDLENNESPFALNLWIDDDGDGIPRWWEQSHGMSDSNPANATLDADGDGFDALAEFLSGTDPNNNQSKLGVGQFNTSTSAETGISTSAISWAPVVGRLYRVERSFDLSAWQIVADDVEPTPPQNSVTDATTPPGGRVFYRVVVK
ncbi:CARDB domain-containing protein [Prosthecobacter sp.]|uniref:CARDB domain-containing protein n=1 Tax=Prosthecobacter sp. TaxID=1965333 RepID=UPI0025F7BA97|nr:CARDB domain-containing protein [Prosthecobacter sp.]